VVFYVKYSIKSYECVIIVFGEVAADECDVIDAESMWSANTSECHKDCCKHSNSEVYCIMDANFNCLCFAAISTAVGALVVIVARLTANTQY
jgi:hypothetical protein